MDRRGATYTLALAPAVCVWALGALFPLERLGEWLRALSLSGPAGNARAWALVLGLAALPALGLLWRGRRWCDWLLLLTSGEILAGLFFLVNPTLLAAAYDAAPFVGMAACGCVSATLLAWAALRMLGQLLAAPDPGRAMAGLLRWSALAWACLAVLVQGIGLWQKITAAAQRNTALPTAALMPTYLVLAALAAANLAPTLLGCRVLRWGGTLALHLEEDPFGEKTVSLAETLSRRCGRIAALSAAICVAGNLLQFLLLPVLHTSTFTVSFPFVPVLLAAALGLLCRYFRRAKAVSDDNGTII